MRTQRGFSLVEVLCSLVILAIVITTTLAMFVERNRRIAQANETILAYQILWNEAEVRRRIDFDSLETAEKTFITETTLLKPLTPFTTSVTVAEAQTGTKNVDLVISWMQGKRTAKLTLTRVDTGGENLW